jgi:hypothetical protein
MAYNFQTDNNKTKLFMERRRITEKVLFGTYKIFCITISYFVSSFILLLLVWKLYAMETQTII